MSDKPKFDERTAPAPASRDACQCCSGRRGVPGNENIVDGVTLCDYCSAVVMQFDKQRAKPEQPPPAPASPRPSVWSRPSEPATPSPTPQRLTPARLIDRVLEVATRISVICNCAGSTAGTPCGPCQRDTHDLRVIADELRTHAAYLETLDDVLRAAQSLALAASAREAVTLIENHLKPAIANLAKSPEAR